MFTGIVAAVGRIETIKPAPGGVRLHIATAALDMGDVQLGDSIAVNGVCLTAVALGKDFFSADVSNETLSLTSLAHAKIGAPVNLELALTPTTRLGGHIVSGHVDGIGPVVDKKNDGRSIRFTLKAPDELAKYIAQKGSICIDGISLTVNHVNGAQFDINIVPYTLSETTLNHATVGTQVNLEVDLLARYMERLMKGDAAAKPYSAVTMELLQNSGFIAQ
jgi:riboflavin synthase